MSQPLQIALIEPFFGGSHKSWAEQLSKYSEHEFTFFTLEAENWRWRMRGGAITLAREFMESNVSPDLILASDMLDLTTFLSLTRTKTHNIPTTQKKVCVLISTKEFAILGDSVLL